MKRGQTGVQFFWRTRSGHEMKGPEVWRDTYEQATEDARAAAFQCGYPGHQGGWWNYFVDDCVALMRRWGIGGVGVRPDQGA